MSTGPDEVTSTTTTEPPQEFQPIFSGLANILGGQFGFQGTSPFQSLSPKDRKRYARLETLRSRGKRFKKQARLETLLGLNPGQTIGREPPDFSGVQNILSGMPGSNLIGQGADLVGSTLQGDFLSPDSNPFLQQTFDRAADLTRTRLSSEFAGSGRNLDAALPARSDELQTLASNIFGGNFQAERDRQNQALVGAQQFDPINLIINRLAGLIPNAGGVTSASQPIFRTGLF